MVCFLIGFGYVMLARTDIFGPPLGVYEENYGDNGKRVRAQAVSVSPNLQFSKMGPVCPRGETGTIVYRFKKNPLQRIALDYKTYPAPGFEFRMEIRKGAETVERLTDTYTPALLEKKAASVHKELGTLGLARSFEIAVDGAVDASSQAPGVLLIDDFKVSPSPSPPVFLLFPILSLVLILAAGYREKHRPEHVDDIVPEHARPNSVIARLSRVPTLNRIALTVADAKARFQRLRPRWRNAITATLALVLVFATGTTRIWKAVNFSAAETRYSSDNRLYLLFATAQYVGIGQCYFSAPEETDVPTLVESARVAAKAKRYGKNCGREPLWPFVLGMAYHIFGPHRATHFFLNMLFILGSTLLVFLIVRRLFRGWMAAFLASLLYFRVYSLTIEYSPFMTALTQLLLLSLTYSSMLLIATRKTAWLIASAICAGLVAMTRFAFTPALPFFCLLPLIVYWRQWRRAILLTILYAFLVGLPNFAWVLRNHAVFGVYVHTYRGGWNLMARTINAGRPGYPPFTAPEIVEKELNIKLPEANRKNQVRLDSYYLRVGLKGAYRHPANYLKSSWAQAKTLLDEDPYAARVLLPIPPEGIGRIIQYPKTFANLVLKMCIEWRNSLMVAGLLLAILVPWSGGRKEGGLCLAVAILPLAVHVTTNCFLAVVLHYGFNSFADPFCQIFQGPCALAVGEAAVAALLLRPLRREAFFFPGASTHVLFHAANIALILILAFDPSPAHLAGVFK